MRVYFDKGVKCGREGSILTHSLDNKGNVHIDLCTDDLYPITVDHIKPVSKGGSDDIDNLQPMCYSCNVKKGNSYDGFVEEKYLLKKGNNAGRKVVRKKSYDVKIGDLVYKKISNKFLGEIIDIKPNDLHPRKVLSAQIKERGENSLYNMNSLYKINENI